MKDTTVMVTAIALAIYPAGVDAEILSQRRLAEILNTTAVSPVSVETLQSRDRDLLVTLGITLREKYGSILVGSEIVFTRTERAGRIVYRMDFINLKNEEHAKGICEILQMEACLIMSDNGDAALVSAEFDEDELLNLDRFVPVSGAVRMEKLPSKPVATTKDLRQETMRLPMSRPEFGEAETPAFEDAGAADRKGTVSQYVDTDATVVEEKSRSVQVERPKPEISYEVAPRVELESPDVSVQYDRIERLRVPIPSVSVSMEERHPLPAYRPPMTILASLPSMDLPVFRPAMSSLVVLEQMPLPKLRPIPNFGLQDHLPFSREWVLNEPGEQAGGVQGELQASLGDWGISFIADRENAIPLFSNGFGIVISAETIAASLDGFSIEDASRIMVSLPQVGRVAIPHDLSNIKIAMAGTPIETRVEETDQGLELEIEGIDEATKTALPRVFVLSFADDGVRAFSEPRVEPAAPNFEIASVVMNDAFARPFDIRGDGQPALQKLPKGRPDLDLLRRDISLVSQPDAGVLLDQLLAAPIQVAQVPGASSEPSPGARLMEKLSEMGSEKDSYSGSHASKSIDAVAETEEVLRSPRSEDAAPIVSSDIVVSSEIEEELGGGSDLPKATDGLVDLNALEKDRQRNQALQVLGEIAEQAELETAVRPTVQSVAQPSIQMPTSEVEQLRSAPASQVRKPRTDARGIFEVAGGDRRAAEVETKPSLRIELSYASSRQGVSQRAEEIRGYIPKVILGKGRLYGYRTPSNPNSFIIGIEANDLKSRDDIIWYLEQVQIPYAIRK